MNSLVKVFSNFKEFYSEINGATLTGAIDVIVVEQPDGQFQCSPFHVRFGKLGVLRSREKVVDIEINGEPVDIHMKLGESGEAFFVEECPEEDVEKLPDNLATSPIPINNHFAEKYIHDNNVNNNLNDGNNDQYKKTINDMQLPLPRPRRNSIDLSQEANKDVNDTSQKFENQTSDFSHRRYTDNALIDRQNMSKKVKEYTTQKIRQEWAEHEDIFQFDSISQDPDWRKQQKQQLEGYMQPKEYNKEQQQQEQINEIVDKPEICNDTSQKIPITSIATELSYTNEYISNDNTLETAISTPIYNHNCNIGNVASNKAALIDPNIDSIKEEAKSKRKRKKRSQMKKKNLQRKSSSSSSLSGSTSMECGNVHVEVESMPDYKNDGDNVSGINVNKRLWIGSDDIDINSMATSINTTQSSSTDEVSPKSNEALSAPLITATAGDDSLKVETCQTSPQTPNLNNTNNNNMNVNSNSNNNNARPLNLDIHFFSDTEITNIGGGGGGVGGGGNGAGGLISGGAGGNNGINVGVRGIIRPSTPIQSDSEVEISMRERDTIKDLINNSANWNWGELPTPEIVTVNNNVDNITQAQAQRNSMLSNMFNFMKKNNKIRKQVNDGGIYLSDLDVDSMDPKMLAMYFPKAPIQDDISRQPATDNETAALAATMKLSVARIVSRSMDDDRESGNGTSLPHSPTSIDGQKSSDSDYEDGKYLDFIAMSLCGLKDKHDPTDEEFKRHAVKYKHVCENPKLFESPNLVVRLNGKYYSWAAACPIIMTIIAFQKPLTNDAIERLTSSSKPDNACGPNADVNKSELDANTPTTTQSTVKRSWWYWRRSQQTNPNENANANTNANSNQKANDGKALESNKFQEVKQEETDVIDHKAVATTQTTRPNSPDVSDETLSKTDSIMNAENTSALVDNIDDFSQTSSKGVTTNPLNESMKSNKNERYKKSLRLSSEAIKQLNLKEGMNEIEFSVTTAYQGTTRCKCYLFRWKYNDKVVISDIDGTITKSDVLGHILPMVGKDWAQLGVAQLFSKIEQNGYKLLYLSARAIGQSRVTREYLRSIRQGDVKLPDGPLLLNPTSLILAFHREVIERKPEQFKIACLSDIKELFPNKDPFYAGYGNRINDVWAYRAVGIPIKRIFTINTKGELKHELTQTFQSSYCNMTFIVDQVFPPIKPDDVAAIEFSHFNYWRDPIPDIDFDNVIKGVTTSASSYCSNTSTVTRAPTEIATVYSKNKNNDNNADDPKNSTNADNMNNFKFKETNNSTFSKVLATIPEN